MMYPKSQWRGGRLFQGMPEADFEKTVQWNKQWMKSKISEGYTIVDIGSDGRSVPSRFYAAELEAISESGAARVRLKKFGNGETVAQMRSRISGC